HEGENDEPRLSAVLDPARAARRGKPRAGEASGLMLDREAIRANVAAVESKIAAACARAGRSPDEVTLVAVTKTFPAIAVDDAAAAGITNVGENRVQEARDKRPETTSNVRWHLIGHLQSNKAKDAVKLFDVIQSVDSIELAENSRAPPAAGSSRFCCRSTSAASRRRAASRRKRPRLR